MKDLDTYLNELNTIFENTFLPEIRKKDHYKNARYIKTIEKIYMLKHSIKYESVRKHLMYICQMNKDLSVSELSRRWNMVGFFGAITVTVVSIVTLMNDMDSSYAPWIQGILILLNLVMLTTLVCAVQASRPVQREVFFDLVLKILDEDITPSITDSSQTPTSDNSQ